MSILINIASIVFGVFIIVVICKNIVKKKINERQALLWILIGVGFIILGMWPSLLQWLAEKTGIWYPPAILFAVAVVGILLVIFHHTVTISILNSRVQELTMQVAILKNELALGDPESLKEEGINKEEIA